MALRSLGFATDLALLRASGSQIADRGTHLAVRTPDNPTFWWGNFLLLREPPASAASVGEWIARFAEEFPDAQHLAIGIDTTAPDPQAAAHLTAAGLTVTSFSVMTASEVHEPAHRNRAATLRPLASDEDWAQQVELMVSDNDGHPEESFRTFTTQRVAAARSLVSDHGAQWFGAFLDGRLRASLGLVPAGDRLARFQDVLTDADWRRQGLAGTLVHTASRHGLDVMGARTLVMVADPDDAAIRIYRAVGFDVCETQIEAQRDGAHGGSAP